MSNPPIKNRIEGNLLKFLGQTSTLLIEDGSYQSSVFDVSKFRYISGICKSDQDGSLYIEFSHDGTNFYGEESYSYSANESLAFQVPSCAIYSRIRFLNGPTAQGSFNLIYYASM